MQELLVGSGQRLVVRATSLLIRASPPYIMAQVVDLSSSRVSQSTWQRRIPQATPLLGLRNHWDGY